MRVLLIAVGSRGDAEPFCSLAQQLLLAKHEVELFLQPEHQSLVPKGCNFHKLPFHSQDFYKYVGAPTHGADHPDPRVKFIGVVVDIIAALVLPVANEVSETVASNNVDLMVCSSLARPLALAVAEKNKVPLAIVHLQPLAPTGLFPHYSDTDGFIKAVMENDAPSSAFEEEYINTYWELEKFQHDFLKERLDEIYRTLGLTEDFQLLSFDDLKEVLSGNRKRIHIANCFSQAIIPPDLSCAKNNIHNIGPLADSFVPKDNILPPELQAFLDSCCDPPVCIGYGSMPFDKVELVVDALKELDEKAILVGDAFQLSGNEEYAKHNTFQVSSVPYPLLLSKCSMMLCHGGAGVVNACLRAGVPAIISPLMGDQFSHAKLLEARGVGAQAGTLPTLTKETIVQGIQAGKLCKVKAKEIGEAIQAATSGVIEMSKLLETIA